MTTALGIIGGSLSPLVAMTAKFCPSLPLFSYGTGGKQKAGGPNPALHLVSSGPTPCFYPAAVPSSLPLELRSSYMYTVLNYIRPLKATTRLMWPPVKMSLTPLI